MPGRLGRPSTAWHDVGGGSLSDSPIPGAAPTRRRRPVSMDLLASPPPDYWGLGTHATATSASAPVAQRGYQQPRVLTRAQISHVGLGEDRIASIVRDAVASEFAKNENLRNASRRPSAARQQIVEIVGRLQRVEATLLAGLWVVTLSQWFPMPGLLKPFISDIAKFVVCFVVLPLLLLQTDACRSAVAQLQHAWQALKADIARGRAVWAEVARRERRR
ncbi:hypothetical protein IE81DRAFT_367936 [Ceraceosorus guamensis]|uniref:Uncharacterized protein n=1 Tax=Ceraceosorus guamensis TaxID=1522189 RepID=A0A316VX75_9BASI|nr:hypothetical protein IE81DRAFT_367936 [Ceraceosorus guamensis]PWN40891.1 hypothetical protein IE81DRAFT_367936 [Ceraceosorus guamensis]